MKAWMTIRVDDELVAAQAWTSDDIKDKHGNTHAVSYSENIELSDSTIKELRELLARAPDLDKKLAVTCYRHLESANRMPKAEAKLHTEIIKG